MSATSPIEAMNDDLTRLKRDWSVVLSRYASLLGFAVPVFRLELADLSLDNVDISSFQAKSAINELWRTRFSRANSKVIAVDQIEVTGFPLLYLDNESFRVELIRGRAGSQGYLAERADGTTHEIAKETLLANPEGLFQLSTDDQMVAADANQRSASQWFITALLAYRPIFVEALGATFLASLVGLGAAMFTMQVYDRVVPTQGYSTLMVLSVGVFIAILLELVIKQTRAYMVDRATKAIDQDLSAVFFGKALDIRMDARPRTVGTFASQVRQFESVRNFLTASTLFVFADAPFALFFIVVIAMIGGSVALVPMIIVPIVLIVGWLFRKPIERYTFEHMEESNRKNGLLVETIDGIESLKAVNADWKMLATWRALTAKMATSELKLRSVTALSTNLAQTLQQLSYIGMIIVGAYLITQGELTMGALIACSIIGGRALAPIAQVPNMIVQWQHAKIALSTLDNIMDLPGERDPKTQLLVPDHLEGRVKIDQASFTYDEDVAPVVIEKFQLIPGQRVAVLGSIGSGKSTFLKLLAGLIQPQSGQVSIDGLDMTQVAPELIRERVGYLPQDVRLFSGTLKENLLLGLPLMNDSTVLAACEATGLAQAISSHPKGLDLPILEGGKGLSGGQRQLVGITRMLLAKPSVLLMDEPTASMDSQSELRVMQRLFEQTPKDHSIVVVTHKPGVLPQVDRLVVMDRGRIVMDGPRDAVLQALKERVDKAMATQQAQAPKEETVTEKPAPEKVVRKTTTKKGPKS